MQLSFLKLLVRSKLFGRILPKESYSLINSLILNDLLVIKVIKINVHKGIN